MSYLDKFDREVEKFCIKNHQAKNEMKKKLMSSGRNQMGHFVAGKPVKEVYERFSVRDDFIKESPGGNLSVLGNPVYHYFTQDYPLPQTLADFYTPSRLERKRLERLRTQKEMGQGRPVEIGFTGERGRPPRIDLELPPEIQTRQQFSRGGILLGPGTSASQSGVGASQSGVGGIFGSFGLPPIL